MLDLDDDRAVGQPPGDRHPAGGNRLDGRPDRRSEIEPVVEMLVARALVAEPRFAGEAGRPEALGDPAALDRPDNARAVAVGKPDDLAAWVNRLRETSTP